MEVITWLNDLVNCFAVKLKLFALTSALLLKEDLESLNQEVCDHLGSDASSLPHPFFFVYHLFLTLPSGGKITKLHWTECQDRPGGKTAVEKGKVASGHCSCTCRLPYIWQRQYCGNGQQGCTLQSSTVCITIMLVMWIWIGSCHRGVRSRCKSSNPSDAEALLR